MNEVKISNRTMPLVNGCDSLIALEPFLHADRTLPFHVLIYVTEGVIYVTEENPSGIKDDYEVHAGELLFLSREIHHYGTYSIPKGTKWFYVHFHADCPKTAEEYSEKEELREGEERKEYQLALPKKLSGLEENLLEQNIKAFMEYYYADDARKAWDIDSRFFELLTQIAFWRGSQVSVQTTADRIANYLNEHLEEPFSAKQIEQHFFLSYKHLAALFKKEKQLTMQQYHTKLRMEEAGKLLATTLLSVGEISEKIGYADMLYFSRCFHQIMGMSPSEYRKSRLQSY